MNNDQSHQELVDSSNRQNANKAGVMMLIGSVIDRLFYKQFGIVSFLRKFSLRHNSISSTLEGRVSKLSAGTGASFRPAERLISTVVELADHIVVYDQDGRITCDMSALATHPDDGLIGYTSTRFTVRRDRRIYVYDAMGRPKRFFAG